MFEINRKLLFRIFWGVGACIVLYWLLHETERVGSIFNTVSDVLAPFVIGGVLAFILNVPVRFLENSLLKKIEKTTVKRLIAIILTFFALLLILAVIVWLLVPQLINTVNSLIPALSDFVTRSEQKITEFLNENPKLLAWLKNNTDFETFDWTSLVKDTLSKFGGVASTVLGGAISAIGGLFTLIFNAVISVVFCIYCLFQKETLSRQGRKILYAFLKESTADNIIRILRLTNSTFSNFLSGQCIEVVILGVMFAICMAIFRMPYIPLISVVIAVTAFIPIVGAWVGCILGAFLILVQDPMLAVWFVIMFLIIQQIENNLIYPRVVGNSVGLSGMWVLVAVTIGGELMGVIGMFLMIPIASVLHTLFREAVNKKLNKGGVAAEKLEPQPPELRPAFNGQRTKSKRKFFSKKQ